MRPLRPRPRVEPLEARILYSADPASAVFDAMSGMVPVERRVVDAPVQQACLAVASDNVVSEPRHELVLVDTRVNNWQQLVNDIPRGDDRNVEVVLLDPGRDGIAQISERLAQEHGLDAVHIVSHAEPGALQIGATRLDFETLLNDATAVSRWRSALNDGADLLLYGCDLAATDEGRALVDALSRLTGADVAASIDATGGTKVGGDWVLEYSTGSIQSTALAGASGLAAWDGSLGFTPSGTEGRANVTTSGTQSTHESVRQVGIDAAGNFVVVWNDSNGDVYGRRFDAAGNPLSGEFRINTTTANTQYRVTVAMNASGAFVVAWESDGQDGSGLGVYAQRYDASGVAQGGEVRINQQTSLDQGKPSVAIDSAGKFIVTWTSDGQDGSGFGVYARRFGADGSALGNEFRVNTTTANDQQHSSVALNDNGDFVIAWQGQDSNGLGDYCQRFNGAGVAQGVEFRVNTTTASDQDYPSVAMAASGDFVVAWSSLSQDGSGWGTYAQRYSAAGVAQGGEFRVNTTTSGDQDFPTVAMDSRGNFLVSWESQNQDASASWGVYARMYDKTGTAQSGEMLINTTTSGDQSYASVAWNGTQAVYVWQGNGAGDSSGVFFRTVDASVAGVTVSAISGNTTEAGGTATFSVVLTGQPTSDVTISFASDHPGEGTVSTSLLTFDTTNWNRAQTVTVAGVDDAADDGDVAYIITGKATSADLNYDGMVVADVSVTNVDNDTGVPTITGTATEDRLLTVNTAGITDTNGGGFSYQWLRDGVDIGGATASAYMLGDADVGRSISVRVSYTNGHGSPESPTSAAVGPVVNVNDTPTGLPTISGTATEDQLLTAVTSGIGDADGLGSFSYQWLRNGGNIGGATAGTYTLGDADVGAQISVRVGYTDGHGTVESIDSAAVGPVVNVNDAPSGLPTIGGTPTEDQQLTADTSAISDADGLGSFSYQWWRGGAMIGGATASTYVLGDADVGQTISVQVGYVDAHGTFEALTSSEVGPVANVNDAPVITSAGHVDILEGQLYVINVASTDVDADLPHYAIVGGADAAQFVIDNDTGELRLRNPPDAEAPLDSNHDNVYAVTVEVSDGHGGTAAQSLDVAVLGVNEAPSVSVSGLSVPPGGAVTLSQLQIAVSDVDSPANTLTFSVSGVVNGHFELTTQPGTAIASFSESALESGLVTLVHDAGTPAPQFVITVSDGHASSAPLLVQASMTSGGPAPTHQGGIDTAPPPEQAASPAPAAAPKAAAGAARPSVADSGQPSRTEAPNLPRPSSQIDEAAETTRMADSTSKTFHLTLPALPSRNGEADEISWLGNDSRKVLFLALGYDADARAGKELDESDKPRLALASDQDSDAVHLELENIVLQTLGIALTAGSVWWALRATSLVTALLASLPAWQQFDFLPVLADEEDEDAPDWSAAEDAEAARDEAAVGRDMFVEGVLR